jgi:hypothetical protein
MPAMVETLRALKAKIVLCKFYLTITSDGILRWLVVPQSVDSENSWHASREKCAVLARRSWASRQDRRAARREAKMSAILTTPDPIAPARPQTGRGFCYLSALTADSRSASSAFSSNSAIHNWSCALVTSVRTRGSFSRIC